MSEIKPFKAIRPNEDEVSLIASPPYDILKRHEALELVRNNPISFLHVVKAEVDFPDEVNIYDERVYQRGRENLEKLINKGHLIQEETPSFYLYSQEFMGHIQNGLVCLASVDEYDRDRIKKHELTRKSKEEDRTKHINTLNAQTGPVFLTYRDRGYLKDLHRVFDNIKKRTPLYKFGGDDKVIHTVWKIDDNATINLIQSIMEKAPYLYIADGHHRSKAASIVREARMSKNKEHNGKEEYNYFLTVIFPHTELNILAYNRVVKDTGGFSSGEFLDKIKEKFIIEQVDKRYEVEGKHNFGMYLDGKWYHLKVLEGSYPEDNAVLSLDSSILQENLLAPILGIKKPKQSDRIDFIGGIKGLEGLEKLVDSGEFSIAFALYPTSMDELIAVADAGLNMPPKSTWFEPKLKSGLFIHML